ncbi:MAG TPA: hypothetical protein P5056_02570 [Candidatus Paceibacterota bacterium]|nr:hypothetical protein [Candidatus Paceibacterota bacterium]
MIYALALCAFFAVLYAVFYKFVKLSMWESFVVSVITMTALSIFLMILCAAAHASTAYGYSVAGNEQSVTLAPKAPDEFWFSRGYIVNVPDDKTFEVNVEAARLDWCDDMITEERFPFTRSDSGQKEMFIMGREGITSYDLAKNEILNRGFRAATLQEALAFIKAYPQRPGTEMLILGQGWTGKGGIWYTRYRVSGSGSSLDAFSLWPAQPWFDVCFLVVKY